jgi:hypothetical protein
VPRLARLGPLVATVLGAYACGGGGEVARTPVGPTDNHAPPVVAHPAIDVRTLYAADAYDAIPRATRVRSAARLRLASATEPAAPAAATAASTDTEGMRDQWWPVIAEREAEVRLAYRDDESVVAAWIDRGSLATSVIAPSTLARDGRPLPVTLEVGAEVARGAGGQVTLVHEFVEAGGVIGEAAIGDVFDRPGERRASADGVIGLEAGADVWRAATSSASEQPVARLRHRAPVILEQRDRRSTGRRAVTYLDGEVEVRGFVESAAVEERLGVFGRGGGHGIGASHAVMLPTPAGTCLYAPDTDEVVGITVATSTRYAYSDPNPEWWRVLVWTPWGIENLRVRDAAGAGLVEAATLRSCLPE